MDTTNGTKDEVRQDYAAVLMQHDKGILHTEASRALADVVQAVNTTRKKGTVTVTLTVSPGKADDVITLEGSVASKKPVAPKASIWFTNDAGVLQRDNPNQPSMFGPN